MFTTWRFESSQDLDRYAALLTRYATMIRQMEDKLREQARRGIRLPKMETGLVAETYRTQPAPFLVVAPDAGAAEALASDLALFLGESASTPALERKVHLLPAWDVPPFEPVSPSAAVVTDRIAALFHLLQGRAPIVVTEVPYQVNKSRMLEQIAEMVRDKRIEGISELRDESDRDGVRVVIELKRDAIAEVVLNQLFRYSQLQTSFGINSLALNRGRPVMRLRR